MTETALGRSQENVDVHEGSSRLPVEPLTGRSARRKPAGGPKELTAKHRLLVQYLTFGVDHPDLLQRLSREERTYDPETGEIKISRVPVKPGQPLSVDEAAELIGLRKRNARELLTLPIVQKALAVAAQQLRTGEHARSLHTMIGLRDDPGMGKAADRKVRLSAAQALIGEGDGSRSNVTVNVGAQLVTPGYVIDLTPQKP